MPNCRDFTLREHLFLSYHSYISTMGLGKYPGKIYTPARPGAGQPGVEARCLLRARGEVQQQAQGCDHSVPTSAGEGCKN